MCGRFSVHTPKDQLISAFQGALPELDTEGLPDFVPRYNIAPSQSVLAIGQSEGRLRPKIALLKWGLIPSFIKDPKASPAPINVRAESAAQKPMFRQAFSRRRCLVLADGFYEWKREGASKQPYYFRMADRQPFAFAGIYETWRGEGAASPIISCAIFTTGPNDLLRPIHDRMPAILEPEHYALWCDPKTTDAAKVQPFLKPYSAAKMLGFPVSSYVNSPRNDDPRCLDPLRAA
ncbi:SOS response-associated peptidase [Candidatus Sumerlaeota bacterium]|nr:SOS response-associated peptidase [Candidatus Sumerlaeota bacterium]MBI3736994.1 SOS response-associated peptidase [Candidatus Sumerlaeota bacterium]